MKTTLNIDDTLLQEAMKAVNAHTKTEAVERGLQALVDQSKREKLARLFGSNADIKEVTRRRPL